jgi:bifunctional enzyme CysN/CysC
MAHKSHLIESDIDKFLKQHETKEQITFLTCGSVDDGKSTLIGRLLHDSNLIFKDQVESLKRSNTNNEENEFTLAHVVDGLQAEREQGITIDVAYRYFSTEKRNFIVADSPGHIQYTRNMATGAANANLAIILVDVTKGITTQTRRHTYLANLLGIKHIIVAINKIDLVSYEQNHYQRICKSFKSLCSNFSFEGIRYIPISALFGDNVVHASENIKWYSGPSLMESLNTVEIQKKESDSLRLPIQYVNRPNSNFRGYCGTITSGDLTEGQTVKIQPSGLTSKIKKVISHGNEVTSAGCHEAVTITLEDELDIGRGDLVCDETSSLQNTDCCNAKVVWMNESPLELNRNYDFKIASKTVHGYIDYLHSKVCLDTLKNVSGKTLNLNEIGTVRINFSTSIPLDIYQKFKKTGAAIIIDRISNKTSGIALVEQFVESKHVIWHEHHLTKQARSHLKGHKACAIWLTGLSASGKSTIANALEDKLNRLRIHTYILDGDNVRHGLTKDLGFSADDRKENIRRIGETAKLFVDAGIIVISAFISPYEDDRMSAKELMEESEFIEVFVDAPIEVCKKRDPKGLYKKAMAGEIKEFTGISSPYESPKSPNLHLKTAENNVEECVEKIIQYLENKKYF